ncbi:sodium:solute symporter family transporter, partial [Halomonas sp. ALS9]|uniref:sodium:solute symporter family transporter n=1 Tax=Halomonas sp. ALS9 TaxID=1805819 RepID=UPI003F8C9817
TLGVVLLYTVVGGFLAVSMTDFVQGCIMMLALVIMPAVVLFGEGGGGLSQANRTLNEVDTTMLSWTSGLT